MSENTEIRKSDPFLKRAVIFIAAGAAAVCLVVFFAFDKEEFPLEHARMTWNVFLSFSSFFMYLSFRIFYKRKNKLLSILAFCMWILFLPNTFYMLTDLKYISQCQLDFFSKANITDPAYIRSWMYTFGMFFPVIAGIYYGIAALIDFEYLVLGDFHPIIRELAVLTLINLCGFAVMIGRFARVNSWDVLNPEYLFSKIRPYFSVEGLIYTMLFSIISWLCYVLTRGLLMLFKR